MHTCTCPKEASSLFGCHRWIIFLNIWFFITTCWCPLYETTELSCAVSSEEVSQGNYGFTWKKKRLFFMSVTRKIMDPWLERNKGEDQGIGRQGKDVLILLEVLLSWVFLRGENQIDIKLCRCRRCTLELHVIKVVYTSDVYNMTGFSFRKTNSPQYGIFIGEPTERTELE